MEPDQRSAFRRDLRKDAYPEPPAPPEGGEDIEADEWDDIYGWGDDE